MGRRPVVALIVAATCVGWVGFAAGVWLYRRASAPNLYAIQADVRPREAFNVLVVPNAGDYGDLTAPDARARLVQALRAEVLDAGIFRPDTLGPYRRRLNFWLTDRTALVVARGDHCAQAVLPALGDLALAPDATLVIHRAPMADCAIGNVATSEDNAAGTVLHELAHAVLGLPDEYCCTGAYWHAPPFLQQAEMAMSALALPSVSHCAFGLSASSEPKIKTPADAYLRGNGCSDTMMARSGRDVRPFGPAGDVNIARRFQRAFPEN